MREITVNARLDDYEKAEVFIEKELQRSKLSRQIISENVVVFEALFNDIIMSGYPEDTEIKLQIKSSFGNPSVIMGFAGGRYVPCGGESIDESVEYKIIKGYEDKLDFIYQASYNIIRLNVKRAYAPQIIFCGAGIAAAMILYAALSKINPGSKDVLLGSVVLPVENLFADAMLLIGTPLTFFSVLKNLLETYIVSARSSNARKLQSKTLETSAAAVVLAVLLGLVLNRFTPFLRGAFGDISVTGYYGKDLPELISSFMPSDIFEVFKMLSPFPLILISLLMVVALRSAGGQFDKLKSAIDAGYVLFSKMLNLVMFFLPAFCFLAFLHILLSDGFSSLAGVALCLLTTVAGLVILFLTYAVRLKLAGIPVLDFVKRLRPVLKENLKINSAIDAIPYNIRQCSRIFGISRGYLEDAMPVLSQTNLDGNCFIIMTITMLLIASSGSTVPWWNYLFLAALVLFLSLGAPNQPGSILIGVVIIINYLKIPQMIPVAIYCEVLLGAEQNYVNVVGDLVMAAVGYRKLEKRSGRSA